MPIHFQTRVKVLMKSLLLYKFLENFHGLPIEYQLEN